MYSKSFDIYKEDLYSLKTKCYVLLDKFKTGGFLYNSLSLRAKCLLKEETDYSLILLFMDESCRELSATSLSSDKYAYYLYKYLLATCTAIEYLENKLTEVVSAKRSLFSDLGFIKSPIDKRRDLDKLLRFEVVKLKNRVSELERLVADFCRESLFEAGDSMANRVVKFFSRL